LTIKLPYLATPRYATKADTNFWLRIPTNNQQPLTFHENRRSFYILLSRYIGNAICFADVPQRQSILIQTAGDSLHDVRNWYVKRKRVVQPAHRRLLKAKLINAWPGSAAPPCLSAKQRRWVETRKGK
jgi:hypothetical protein